MGLPGPDDRPVLPSGRTPTVATTNSTLAPTPDIGSQGPIELVLVLCPLPPNTSVSLLVGHAGVVGGGAGRGPGAAGVDFFVSHVGRDQAWAEWVAWHLVEAGYTVELDCWDWAVGENFLTRMHRALDAANRVVALFSPAYFNEMRYTTQEWTSALIHHDDRGGPRLVPVQVEPCTVPSLLRPLVCVNLVEVDEPEAARRLIAAACGPARPDGKPVFPGHGRTGMLTGRGEVSPRLPGVLPAVWNVGPRNPGFVGRDATLVHLRERLRSGGTAVVQALHGMGGVGKTQVALEYAHRYAGAYDLVWWISAEQTSLLGEQYTALATELGLTPPRADTASAAGALRAYLRCHSRWLLLFDNAESPRHLREWLPSGPGHTLITSRNPAWGELAARVDVDVLPRSDSVELIHVFRPGVGEAEADRLAEAWVICRWRWLRRPGFWLRPACRLVSIWGCWRLGQRNCSTKAPRKAIRSRSLRRSECPPTAWPRSIRPRLP